MPPAAFIKFRVDTLHFVCGSVSECVWLGERIEPLVDFHTQHTMLTSTSATTMSPNVVRIVRSANEWRGAGVFNALQLFARDKCSH